MKTAVDSRSAAQQLSMSRHLSEDQLREAREAFQLVDKESTGAIRSQEVGASRH